MGVELPTATCHPEGPRTGGDRPLRAGRGRPAAAGRVRTAYPDTHRGTTIAMGEPTIEDYFTEDRLFPPSDAFTAGALTSDRSLYEEAEADPEAFWARQARELLSWDTDFDTVLDWQLPFARWFDGGTLNV